MKLIDLKDRLVSGMILRCEGAVNFTIKIISIDPWIIWSTHSKNALVDDDFVYHSTLTSLNQFVSDYEIIYNPSEENMPVTLETRIQNIKNELELLENELKESKKPKLVSGKFHQFVTTKCYSEVCMFSGISKNNVRCLVTKSLQNVRTTWRVGAISEIYEISPEETIQNLYSGNVTRNSGNLVEAIRE